VSPDGEWVIIHTPPTGDRTVVEVMAVPIRGGVPKKICELCITGWSQDGKFFYASGDVKTSTSSARRAFAIPVPADQALPDFPVGGITDFARVAALPGARTIEEGLISQDQTPRPTSSPGQTRSAISFTYPCISGIPINLRV
jgi:hypothetical protein